MAPKKRDSRSQSDNAKRSAAESPSKKRFKLGAPVAGSIDLDEDVGPSQVKKASSNSSGKAATKPAPKAGKGSQRPPLPQVNDAKPGLPLEGVTMVFTGEMDAITRQDAEEKAKAAGAKVMSGVSGNVQYLVAGSRLDDGRPVEETSKYRKMMELKEKGKKHPELLTEAQFLALLPDACAARAILPTFEEATVQVPKTGPVCQNWVDHFAPKSLDQLVGNASIVRKLTEWLRDWDDVVLKGRTKKAPFKPGGGMPENINARAALISGPPGIGKTTTCRLVAKLHGGYEVLEFNASDSRGQKIIQDMASGIADNRTLSFGDVGAKKVPSLTKKAIIIMDEVDGMGAGDRGGMAALGRMIKKTRNPIMCICNDSHSPKVRSLAFSCYDLKFSRPTKNTVAQRCAQISASTGLQVETNALEALAESCGSDMRMVLNQLQMLTKSDVHMAEGVKYMDMKEKMRQMNKDQAIMLGPFDACKKLLTHSEGARLSFRDRLDLFFVDHSLMGLLVHENYLNAISKKPVNNELLQRCANSADMMAVGDIIGARIREHQEWSLLPDLGILSAVYPAFTTHGFVAFPSFPTFLGKYSTQSRMRRLVTELQTHLRLTSTASRSSLPTSPYLQLLYKKLVAPLQTADPDAPEEAVVKTVGVLDAYGLRKDHLTEHITELRQHMMGADFEDLFKFVDPKVKNALTRSSNSHAVKVVLPSNGKKRKAKEENPDEMDDDVEKDKVKAEPDEEANASEDEGAASSSLIKVKKPKAKAKSKAKAKAESPTKSKAEAAPKAKAAGKAKAKGKAKAGAKSGGKPKAKAKGR
mmetsp:Transcript_66967/g.157074  ORF Transcript_66967/g.157074 Transcript_66967/m.157074 type:complete len:811 (-) Transcript_66967:60-2492(-)